MSRGGLSCYRCGKNFRMGQEKALHGHIGRCLGAGGSAQEMRKMIINPDMKPSSSRPQSQASYGDTADECGAVDAYYDHYGVGIADHDDENESFNPFVIEKHIGVRLPQKILAAIAEKKIPSLEYGKEDPTRTYQLLQEERRLSFRADHGAQESDLFSLRQVKDGSEGKRRREWTAHTAAILNAAAIKTNASISEAEIWLDAFRKIVENSDASGQIVIPESFRTIRSAVKRAVVSDEHNIDVKSFRFKLSDLLGIGDFEGYAVGPYLDVMDVISDELLSIDCCNLDICPIEEVDNLGGRIRSSFASADVFHGLSQSIKSDYGESAVCLPIAVGVDDTPYGGLRGKSSAPVYIRIVTIKEPECWKEGHTRLIGFAPKFDVSYHTIPYLFHLNLSSTF